MRAFAEFPCRHLSASPGIPYSVHRLRPGDIRVIAGMGDSITAGTGALAENVKQILTEYVGVSFSVGKAHRAQLLTFNQSLS